MSKSRLAIYPGSFDPVTFGHIDIINRASLIFDELIVAVVGNPSKDALFSIEERKSMLKDVVADKPNVKIDGFSGLLMDYVGATGASVVIRGLRAISDFEYEFQMALVNNKLAPAIETVFMMANERYSYVSSRLIKEIAKLGGDVRVFVPEFVFLKLSQKMENIG